MKGFIRLLERYQKGAVTTKEKHAMDIWYDAVQPEEESRADLDEEELKKEMWQDIRSRMRQEPVYSPVVERRWWQSDYFKIAAASVLLVAALMFYRTFSLQQSVISGISDSEISRLEKISNDTSAEKEIMLPDGSRVTLDPGSVLFYSKEPDRDRRIVYLKGSGFFDVARNPEKPFLVYTDDIVTKVLGTSFTIRKNEGSGAIEVAVITGKVIVEKTVGSNRRAGFSVQNGVMLTPNTKVTYYAENERYVTGLVDEPRIIEKGEDYHKPDAFDFREIPLSMVLEKVGKAYGLEIEVSNRKLNNCRITADLSKDDLYGKLEVICAAVNAGFEVVDGKVMMTGEGCDL